MQTEWPQTPRRNNEEIVVDVTTDSEEWPQSPRRDIKLQEEEDELVLHEEGQPMEQVEG